MALCDGSLSWLRQAGRWGDTVSKSVSRKRSSTGVGGWPGDLAAAQWGEASLCLLHNLLGHARWVHPVPQHPAVTPHPEPNSLQKRSFPLGKAQDTPKDMGTKSQSRRKRQGRSLARCLQAEGTEVTDNAKGRLRADTPIITCR